MRGEGEKRSAPLLQDFNYYPNPLYRTVFFVSFSCLNVAENGSSLVIQTSSLYCIRGTREVPVSGASAPPIRAFPQG